MITHDKILNDIKRLSKAMNKTPTKKEYDAKGKYSSSTVSKSFGTWSNAIFKALAVDVSPKQIANKPCKNCGNLTKNPKFCSRSCSTSYSNRNINGRKTGKKWKNKKSFCQSCQKIIPHRRKFCNDCLFNIKIANGAYKHISKVTKKDVLTNDTQRYRRIRCYARKIAKDHNLLEQCKVCNYSLHVDCCHKKPIESFPDETLISIINMPSNLVGLCKNHHWEFDNNLIDIIHP